MTQNWTQKTHQTKKITYDSWAWYLYSLKKGVKFKLHRKALKYYTTKKNNLPLRSLAPGYSCIRNEFKTHATVKHHQDTQPALKKTYRTVIKKTLKT